MIVKTRTMPSPKTIVVHVPFVINKPIASNMFQVAVCISLGCCVPQESHGTSNYCSHQRKPLSLLMDRRLARRTGRLRLLGGTAIIHSVDIGREPFSSTKETDFLISDRIFQRLDFRRMPFIRVGEQDSVVRTSVFAVNWFELQFSIDFLNRKLSSQGV